MLATIRSEHPLEKELHVLAAVPAPAAITLGLMRLPKVDPLLRVYDRDNRCGGLAPAFTIT
jgi:hypothetical protein